MNVKIIKLLQIVFLFIILQIGFTSAEISTYTLLPMECGYLESKGEFGFTYNNSNGIFVGDYGYHNGTFILKTRVGIMDFNLSQIPSNAKNLTFRCDIEVFKIYHPELEGGI